MPNSTIGKGIVAMKDNARCYLLPTTATGVTFDETTGLVAKSGDAGDLLKYKLSTLMTIPGIGGESEKVDATYLSSPSKQSVDGLSDYGTIQLSVGVTKDEAARLSTFKANKADVYLCIAVRDIKKSQVYGLSLRATVSDFKLEDISVNSLISGSLSLSINSEISNEFLDFDAETTTEAYVAAITAAKAELDVTEGE